MSSSYQYTDGVWHAGFLPISWAARHTTVCFDVAESYTLVEILYVAEAF